MALAFCAASVAVLSVSCDPWSPPSVSRIRTLRPASWVSFSLAAAYTASNSRVPRGSPLPVTEPYVAPVLMVALSRARLMSLARLV